jgi:phage tail tape-measure protein
MAVKTAKGRASITAVSFGVEQVCHTARLAAGEMSAGEYGEATLRNVGKHGGTLAGTAIGAAIGTAIAPGVGTAIGAALGDRIGSFLTDLILAED